MADFLGLMKQAAELKSKMETMQAQLDSLRLQLVILEEPRTAQLA